MLSSQPADARGLVRAGGNIAIGFPVGEFSDNVDRVGSGFSAYVAAGLWDLPLSAGGSVGFMTQGSEKIGRIHIGSYVGDLITRNKLLLGHGLVRVQDSNANIAPYLDLLVGFRRFYATTEVKIGFNVPDTDMNSDEWVLSYGAGAGLTYEIYESAGGRDDGSGGHSLCADVGVRYLIGGEADLVDLDSVTVVDNRIGFNTISSRTDMFNIHIGVSFLF
jgi:hypothetical protein